MYIVAEVKGTEGSCGCSHRVSLWSCVVVIVSCLFVTSKRIALCSLLFVCTSANDLVPSTQIDICFCNPDNKWNEKCSLVRERWVNHTYTFTETTAALTYLRTYPTFQQHQPLPLRHHHPSKQLELPFLHPNQSALHEPALECSIV